MIFLKRHQELLATISIGTFTFLLFRHFAVLDPDWHHDSILLKPALDVLRGQTLFSDTFTQYGALLTYLQAAAMKLRVEEIPVRLIYNDPTRTFGGPLDDPQERIDHYRAVLCRELGRYAKQLPRAEERVPC